MIRGESYECQPTPHEQQDCHDRGHIHDLQYIARGRVEAARIAPSEIPGNEHGDICGPQVDRLFRPVPPVTKGGSVWAKSPTMYWLAETPEIGPVRI